MGYWPQPRVLFEPCNSKSAAASGFESWNDSEARCGIRTFSGLNVNDMFAVDVHGPSQLKRPAMCPTCRLRQSRADRDPLDSSACIPDATDVSGTVGAKMNARSFAYPSPLMSPATIGV